MQAKKNGIPGGNRKLRTAQHARAWLMLLGAVAAGPVASAQRAVPGLPGGVDVLMLADPVPPPGASVQWARPAGPTSTSVGAAGLKLGLQWRTTPVSGQQLRAQFWRRVPLNAPHWQGGQGGWVEPVYGARVEMQLAPRKRLKLRDLLGMQLDNGARLSVRPRKGRVSLYYRVQF